MRSYAGVFAPEAQDNLVELCTYIAGPASPAVAERCTDAVVESCERLATVPHQSTRRDDLRPGLRITIDEDKAAVSILGIFHVGRNDEATRGDPDWADLSS